MPHRVYERRKAQPGDPLTFRQQEILDFIVAYLRGHRYPPSYRDICRHFDFEETASVGFLRCLRAKGRVRWMENHSRCLVVLSGSVGHLCVWCQGEILDGTVPDPQDSDNRPILEPFQEDLLGYLRERMYLDGYAPTVRNCCDRFSVTQNSIQPRIGKLARDRYIARIPHIPRAIVLLPAHGSTDCPVCRRPLPAQTGPG